MVQGKPCGASRYNVGQSADSEWWVASWLQPRSLSQQEPMELIPRARDPGISELSKPPNHNRLHSTPRPDSAGRVD